MSDVYAPPPDSGGRDGDNTLDPLKRREHEDLLSWAVKLITFEAAAAIELRGRITTAISLLDGGTDPQHIRNVLEGREPW